MENLIISSFFLRMHAQYYGFAGEPGTHKTAKQLIVSLVFQPLCEVGEGVARLVE